MTIWERPHFGECAFQKWHCASFQNGLTIDPEKQLTFCIKKTIPFIVSDFLLE
jgi:hypothetical protein